MPGEASAWIHKNGSFSKFKSPFKNKRRHEQTYMKILGWVTDSGNKGEGWKEAIESYKKHLEENFLSPCLKYLVQVHTLN